MESVRHDVSIMSGAPHIANYTRQVNVVYSRSSEVGLTCIIVSMTTTPAKPAEARNFVSLAVGDRLKESRIRANVSQLTLASEAHIARQFISEIERGVANPSIGVLAILCHVLGMTLAEFFSELDISLPPNEDEPRRANVAQPKVKPPGSRLR